MANTPITSSNQMVALLEQQLADVVAAKSTALGQIAALASDGTGGPSFSESGVAGSESVDRAGYLATLNAQVREYTETEKSILETLQNLQPYNIPKRVRI